MRHYCTLFDSAYLTKGLTMYRSLAKHSREPFTLHILPMDEQCRWTLEALELPQVKLVNLEKFIRFMDLEDCRKTRTVQEFCWTCASNLTCYLMYEVVAEITYLDADLFFFSDPVRVFAEIGTRSIAITPHRLIWPKKHLEVNGKFNVGWLTFKTTTVAMECLHQWAQDCRDWCYNRVEDGKFGDQKYLDAWPARYGDDLCILGPSVNVAPWNVGNWEVTEGPRVNGVPIVCYHLHEFEELPDGRFKLSNYELRDEDFDYIYRPYLEAYSEAGKLLSVASLKLQGERA